MSLTPDQVMETVAATWPPASTRRIGPVTLRDGQGGGQRVSAATIGRAVTEAELEAAEAAMRAEGRRPLFQCRDGNAAVEDMLLGRGYIAKDETVMYAAPITKLTDVPIPRLTAFTIWEPLAIMQEIWALDGIGPERCAVMARATCKTALFARANDQPAGAGFVGVHDDIAMVHALVVIPEHRRQGVAQWMMRRAAFWAEAQGATWMTVLCVAQNAPANALYRALGFEAVGRYHYLVAPE